ncbi:hypothetical protein [Jeotgalibaca porci]
MNGYDCRYNPYPIDPSDKQTENHLNIITVLSLFILSFIIHQLSEI